MTTKRRLFAPVALLLAALPAAASDLQQERQWAKELKDVVRVGEIRLIAFPPEPPAQLEAPAVDGAQSPQPPEGASAATASAPLEATTSTPAKVPGPAVAPISNEEATGEAAEKAEPVVAGTTETAPNAASPEVFAIFTEQTLGERKAAVLLLHDLGTHPDWPEVIGPLRESLPSFGFSTLAIQLPLPGPNAPADIPLLLRESGPRINAAVAELRKEGYDRIAVVGHGLGGLMGAGYLAEHPEAGVIGFATVGVEEYGELPVELRPVSLWPRLGLPLLDIVGSRETAAVLKGAAAREIEARRKGVPAKQEEFEWGERPLPGYRLLRMAGADHNFSGLEDTLTRRLRGWLEQASTAYVAPPSEGTDPAAGELEQTQAAPGQAPLEELPEENQTPQPAEGSVGPAASAPPPFSNDNLGESNPWR